MANLELVVDRMYKKPLYTIGKLYVDGEYFCDTLEDRDRNLKQTDDIGIIRRNKVPNETAIPTGRYQVTIKVQSPKYAKNKQYAKCKGYLPRVLNVKGFDGILIHIGNTNKDTSGCLLVGLNKVKGQVVESTVTFWKLNDILKKASDAGRMIFITYK